MKEEGVLVGIREVPSVHIGVCGILLWAYSTVSERIANPNPWRRLRRRHEATCARSGSAIGHAFENVDTVPFKST
jgi:hypothetical protein